MCLLKYIECLVKIAISLVSKAVIGSISPLLSSEVMTEMTGT